MNKMKLSLLREKFVIRDAEASENGNYAELTALSNRIELPLHNDDGSLSEQFIIRTQNMHTSVRMAAFVLQEFQKRGPLLQRANPFKWADAWQRAAGEHELNLNPDLWGAVYHNGKALFSEGDYPPFLDVIEKCDFANEGSYESSIRIAEEAFEQTGKNVNINHDMNVALNVELAPQKSRLGIILRTSSKTTTFVFTVTPRDQNNTVRYDQCLNVAAAFLEGIQICFMVGMNIEKVRLGLIEKGSVEDKRTMESGHRLRRLLSEIVSLENSCLVNYRPEKPDFDLLLTEAEDLARRTFTPPQAPALSIEEPLDIVVSDMSE